MSTATVGLAIAIIVLAEKILNLGNLVLNPADHLHDLYVKFRKKA